MKNTAIILAAGNGKRMGTTTQKQFLEIEGFPIVYYSLLQFEKHPDIDDVILVTGAQDIEFCKAQIIEKYKLTKVREVVCGGAERYLSVQKGLLACKNTDYVLVHDGARPFVTADIISRCVAEVHKVNACVVGVPSKDTVKIVDEDGFISYTPVREKVWNMQTPQAFKFQLLKESYEKILSTGVENVTDDAMVVEAANPCEIKVLMGDYSNIKITTPEDLTLSEKIFKKVSKKVLTSC